jgi:hypothetical protein
MNKMRDYNKNETLISRVKYNTKEEAIKTIFGY